MRALKVSEGIVPIAQFKAQAKKWLARLRETGQPIVITQNGKSAGVVLSPEEYDRLTDRRRFVDAVQEGLADLEEGRSMSSDDVRRRLGLARKGRR